MIQKLYITFFTLLLLLGCSPQTPASPKLSDETLVRIIADLHMAEVAAKKVHPKQKEAFLKKYYNQVYQIHHITKEEFESEFATLELNPDHLAEIYKQAQEYVTIMSKEQ